MQGTGHQPAAKHRTYLQGDFFGFFLCMYFIQHCFISDSPVSADAGIEPRTVATSALAVRRSSHSATSHPHSATSHPHLATYHNIILLIRVSEPDPD